MISPVFGLGTVVLAAAAIAGIGFVLIYSILARWWESREGWYLVASSAGFALILTYNFAAVRKWFDQGDLVVQEWTRLAVYSVILVIMVWRGLLLLLAQFDLWKFKHHKEN